MRALLQRVREAEVTVDDQTVGAIDHGLLVFLGVGEGDDDQDLDELVDTVVHLRIFADDDGKMNHSILDVGAEMLVVPQFTLYADTSRGRRPSFVDAMDPGGAEQMCDRFVDRVDEFDFNVESGAFGKMMDVELLNDGPVTIWLDTDDM